MVTRFRKGRCVFAAIALAIMCFGFATPALAEGEPTYAPSEAKLTAVIVAPVGTDASEDEYVFHFAGGGTVEAGQQEESGKIPVYSDGVEQDYTTIKPDDVVPTIPDVTLSGQQLTSGNSLTSGDLGQTVVQMSIWNILKTSGILVKTNEQGSDDLTNYHVEIFPHAGVYTYEVTQTSATSGSSKAYVAASKAKYCLRIWVKNTYIGNSSQSNSTDLTIEHVTVERLKNDDGVEETNENGTVKTEKVNPTIPTADANGKITSLTTASDTNSDLAGDERGRNVPGFTFANEYYTVGPFQVKKLYDGGHSDRTRYSTVELAVHCSVSPDARGGALTYTIEGDGKDLTEGRTANGDQGSKVSFDTNGWCYIKAELKEGSSIRITGELDSKGVALSTNGLFRGQAYYVLENDPGDYRPTGYVYVGTDAVDPRTGYSDSNTLWDKQGHVGDSPENEYVLPDSTTKDISAFALLIENRNTTGNDTIFVVNNLDENKVSPTGILIDNLPYILMIGIPVVVFIALFVLRRRRNASE